MQHSEGTNPVEAVRERLGENGERWLKNDGLGDERGTGPVCIVGAALSSACRPIRGEVYPFIQQVVLDQYRDRLRDEDVMWGPVATIGRFNDHPDTEFPDVERVLEKAAQEYEARQVQS